MPWINRPKKKKRDYSVDMLSSKRQFSHQLYGSTAWQRLRVAKLVANPLCQRCEALNIITLAEEVHHLLKFMNQKTDAEKVLYFYDYNNLMSVCKKCHKILDNT